MYVCKKRKTKQIKHLINGQLDSDLSISRIRRADAALVLWRSLRGITSQAPNNIIHVETNNSTYIHNTTHALSPKG
jgi:hypothetical protein